MKRDTLRKIEQDMQAEWKQAKIYEADAPEAGAEQGEKFMCTFPYPYMNGRLHLGHAFTVSKVEFAASYERMRGKKVLFPFGFHCTGMPIKAAADKLRKEMEKFGNPPVFPSAQDDAGGAAKHSKVAAKTGNVKYQWQIMESIGVPAEEIPKFADPLYWMKYFPPAAQADLEAMGLGADWRRSMITTDANPFYDSFVRWQFNKLRRLGKITFGNRPTIYSPLDGQPCLDHDRASGEGIEPKEYTAIKLKLVDVPASLAEDAAGLAVYLLAATLRPETMYGQTNVWVGTDIEYGLFRISETEMAICTPRAALNLAYQGFSRQAGQVEQLGPLFKGQELLGLAVKAPLSLYPQVHILPMMGVSANKGTGIVTSVPASAPADYAALRDLREKEPMRRKFGLADEHVLPFTPISVVKTPTMGEFGAEWICKELGIRSQNDRDLLERAKEQLYKEDFYQGVMTQGELAGKPVSEAKPLITAQLIASGEAINYWEPDGVVMSRSGDECVVALTDQWFIDYGEAEWRAQAERCLSKMTLYHGEVRNQFESTLGWMRQWACSRSFGLGTRLPWDPKFLIESLSDSTIYNAYYTVAHLLHEGSLDGSVSSVKAEQMTDEVWEWIFGTDEAAYPAYSGIERGLLERMRREFRFFYPIDLRVSGKDLVPNHLTMLIYNHVALFPEQFWPRSIRANGHLLLNSEKMSKSTGNFMTLRDACEEWGADATRMALADAGDSLEDANFLKDTANAAILRLYHQLEWAQSVQRGEECSREQADPKCFADRFFAAALDRAIKLTGEAYQQTAYRDAMKYGWFELQNARDTYRDMTVVHGTQGMAKELLQRFLEVQVHLLCPIAPHWCDHVWRRILRHSDCLLTRPFPKAAEFDERLLAAHGYLQTVAHDLRCSLQAELNPKKKSATPAVKPTQADLLVASGYPAWQEEAISILRQHYDADSKSFRGGDEPVIAALRASLASPVMAKHAKKVMPFAMELKARVQSQGPKAFERMLPFDEHAVLSDNLEYLTKSMGLLSVRVMKEDNCGEQQSEEVKRKWESAIPGEPAVRFY